jgi:hypothetical protein
MQTPPKGTPLLDPHLQMFARVCGSTLLVIFLVSVVGAAVPVSLNSPEWGTQLSNRIIDNGPLALIGVGLLRAAGFLLPYPEPDPELEPAQAEQLARSRNKTVLLTEAGVISLALLALWHLPLFLGSLRLVEQQNSVQVTQVEQRYQQTEEALSKASPAQLNQEWQRLRSSGVPGLGSDSATPEQQRKALLKHLKGQRQEAARTVKESKNLTTFTLLRNAVRSLVICMFYIGAFFALGRRLE